jgi:hypothetical protein
VASYLTVPVCRKRCRLPMGKQKALRRSPMGLQVALWYDSTCNDVSPSVATGRGASNAAGLSVVYCTPVVNPLQTPACYSLSSTSMLSFAISASSI